MHRRLLFRGDNPANLIVINIQRVLYFVEYEIVCCMGQYWNLFYLDILQFILGDTLISSMLYH